MARENMRVGGVEVEVQAEDSAPVLGWAGGLRLAVDNLVRNAFLHGRATRIVLAAHRHDRQLEIVVDDNGCGLPAEEYDTVLGRFARGSTAAVGGSGLGLALVAQQAALHGGSIELSDGPLGGLRATLTCLPLLCEKRIGQASDQRRAGCCAPSQQQRSRHRRRHHDETDRDSLTAQFSQQHADGHGGDPDDDAGRGEAVGRRQPATPASQRPYRSGTARRSRRHRRASRPRHGCVCRSCRKPGRRPRRGHRGGGRVATRGREIIA